MDEKLLISEINSTGLTIISPLLFSIRENYITENDNILIFHDEERSDLFYIHLNEFINTAFISPIDGKKVSLFQLFISYCEQYSHDKNFKKFLLIAYETRDFFFKKRFYKYYLSPYDIELDVSFSDLINFQANYIKHSFYHLDNLKAKLKKYFKQNGVENFENKDYNNHLDYFKEAVLDDRLEYNQTHICIVLGDFFLGFWDLMHSGDYFTIRDIVNDIVKKHGNYVIWSTVKPDNFTEMEEFYWKMKGALSYPKTRLMDNIPSKLKKYPVEVETTKEKILERNKITLPS